ncbi:MAG: hypothetical protein ACYTG5_03750, partial [Planctomycetota bacterium]
LRRGSEEEVVVELGKSPNPFWGGVTFSGDSPLYFSKGNTIFTQPNTSFRWRADDGKFNDLFKLNNQVYTLQNSKKVKGINQLFWNKAKQEDEDEDADEAGDEDEKGDKKKRSSYSVLTPELFRDLSVTKNGGITSFNKLLKDGKNQTYVLPEDDAFGRIYSLNQAREKNDDLAAQLEKMSKELEALKALLEKQQAKSEKKDH